MAREDARCPHCRRLVGTFEHPDHGRTLMAHRVTAAHTPETPWCPGRLEIPRVGDAPKRHCADTVTMKIKTTRTNAKPTGYREVDLPAFDVYGDGQLIGKVTAYLTREYRHHTAGSVRRYSAKTATGRTISNGFANKRDAVAAVAKHHEGGADA